MVNKNKKTKPNRQTPDSAMKTNLTKELIQTITDACRCGNFLSQAFVMAGIDPQTFYFWGKQAKENPEKYPLCVELLASVKKAQAECEQHLVRKIWNEANWTSAAWLLERKFPQRWKRKEHLEVTTPDDSMKPQIIIKMRDNGRDKK